MHISKKYLCYRIPLRGAECMRRKWRGESIVKRRGGGGVGGGVWLGLALSWVRSLLIIASHSVQKERMNQTLFTGIKIRFHWYINIGEKQRLKHWVVLFRNWKCIQLFWTMGAPCVGKKLGEKIPKKYKNYNVTENGFNCIVFIANVFEQPQNK